MKASSRRGPISTRSATAPTVAVIKHSRVTRANIPTAELEPFARESEVTPPTVRYPRDPSLDPQLVWRGKDDLDGTDLVIPAVPIYIQEKIAPQAIIEALRSRPPAEPTLDLFAEFDGLDFERLVEFYQHSHQWTNRVILGDSLMVMTSLAEKEGLRGQVQMIYIDPPYGIRFGSNWQVSTRRRDVRDGRAEDATREPEQVRAFRDTWERGIHSYLTYLRDRLVVARDLLTPSGSVFVQIGVENIHLVRSVLDEVFGSSNFVGLIAFRVKSALSVSGLGRVADYLVWFAKDREQMKFHELFVDKSAESQTEFSLVEFADGRRLTLAEAARRGVQEAGRLFTAQNLASSGYTASCTFDYEYMGKRFPPPAGRSWKTTREGMDRLARAGRLQVSGRSLRFVYYFDDFPLQGLTDVWMDTFGEPEKRYTVQTSPRVVARCLLMTTDPGDLVLDPTCGSGTTSFVAEQWGRRWITIDTSRVALALARTRLMAGRFPYYLLRDSDAGLRKEAEVSGQVPPSPLPQTANDIRQGFVYERIPHVTLKSIANNPDIRDGMSRAEIVAAIERHAETELLYDRPYTDPRVVRVTGPFTVESLSPHRVIDPQDQPAGEADPTRFIALIIDNLRKAGVQNTVKKERLVFESLEQWPGTYVHAMGDYKRGQQTRRCAVAIGPEYGTVGPQLVREAAKEAARAGADLLVVCGFAFEAQVGDDPGQFGKLTVLKAKMNPDLAMGDELLKKTGAGNLFMVFGEPDISIAHEDGHVTVEIRGVDVFDPTTSQLRTHSTDDIAAWFIDTNYDRESFHVRHAYFLGADEPYEKLKKALRAEIDEAAWASLYSTHSRPFPRPETGVIAVKVINHYGDEVLKVYSLDADLRRTASRRGSRQ